MGLLEGGCQVLQGSGCWELKVVNVFWKMGEKCSVIQGNKLISKRQGLCCSVTMARFLCVQLLVLKLLGLLSCLFVGVVGGFLVGFEFRLS